MSVEKAEKSNIITGALSSGRMALTEFEAKEFLAEFGLPITKQAISSSKDEIIAKAKEIGFPVVMKIMADDIIHKSDVGGVKVGISDETAVGNAFDELMKIQTWLDLTDKTL